MKLYGALFAVLLAISSPMIARSEPEVHVTNETQYTINNVSGSGSASSITSENGRYSNRLGVILNSQGEGTQMHFNFGGIATDDRREDLKSMSLQNFQLRLANGKNVFNLGDTFEAFSQYSASSGIKGISYKYGDLNNSAPEVTFMYGIAASRWDNIYGETDVKSVERHAYGVNIKKKLSDHFTAGVNFVAAKDTTRVNPSDQLYDGTVYGATWEYRPFDGLSLSGESQFSQGNLSSSSTSAKVRSDGSAHRVNFDGEGKDIRLNMEYERVTPGFFTALGSAISDREKVKARWRQKVTHDTTVAYGLLWYRDNLEGQLTNTRDNYRPEISWTQRRVFDRKYSSAGLTYKMDVQNGGEQNVRNHYADFNYRDRFGSIDWESNLGYTIYDTSQQVRNSNEYLFNTTLGTRKTIGSVIVKPSLYLGTWTFTDKLANATDRITEYSGGLGLDFPKANITSNFKVGTHKLAKENANDSSRFFAVMNWDYRPRFLAGANDASIFLRAALNDYIYTDSIRNFKESSVILGFRLEY